MRCVCFTNFKTLAQISISIQRKVVPLEYYSSYVQKKKKRSSDKNKTKQVRKQMVLQVLLDFFMFSLFFRRGADVYAHRHLCRYVFLSLYFSEVRYKTSKQVNAIWKETFY